MRFRKKPVVVEAVQFTGDNWSEMHEFTGHRALEGQTRNGRQVYADIFNPVGTYTLLSQEDSDVTAEVYDALHSTHVGVKDGQWIIKGTQGEFYPCDPQVFEQTYEPVGETS